MSIKIGEVNKGIYVDVGFDVNAAPFTLVSLHFKSPDGQTTFTRSSPDVTAPNVNSEPIEVNCGDTVLKANKYLLYLSQSGDFSEIGDWSVCSEYQDADGTILFGDVGTLVVERALPDCF